jgi:dipeptidase D
LHEEAVRDYVLAQASEQACRTRMDDRGNLVVSVPASEGREESPRVIIQNHLDMVTVKSEEKCHDFYTDPLSLQIVDGWLKADDTTLGADNGVGCAAALALMTTEGLSHPPLELLFTVDEETGLGGALDLDPSLLRGELMLNLDTEDWNELYVGCAGGGGWELRREFAATEADPNLVHLELHLKGLAGGHSGIQIHQQLGNAIKLLAQALWDVDGLQLADFEVGVAHNVIPREGRARFACPEEEEAQLRERIHQLREQWLAYLPTADADLEIILNASEAEPVMAPTDSRTVLELIAALPHGAQSYSLEQPADLVETSINLAVLRLDSGKLFVETSFRFFNYQQSVPLQHTVLSLAAAYQLEVSEVQGYPGWQPRFDSPLLARGCELHERLFGFLPAVKAIHAGLECGILKGKKPDLDILSFGPTIRGAHSPGERLQIETVEPFWQFLTELLADI